MTVKRLWVLSIRIWIEHISYTILDASETVVGSVNKDMDRTHKLHYFI